MFSPETVLWACGLLLGYVYVGYPALVCAWAAARPRASCRERIEPAVSIVVVAHNEEARIDARLRNLIDLDYPAGRIEIIVASDGSTDATADRAGAYERYGARVVRFDQRRGKAAVLNDVVPTAAAEIVVLADSRQRFERGALRALVAPLADSCIGAVSGELVLTRDPDTTEVGEGVGFYWRYEKSIRLNESRADSTIGATGAIYAIRRALFEPIPDDTILDDVLIPMRVVRRGYRAVFEPGARAYDRVARTAREEFVRKVRTIAGNYQLFARERWLFDPRANRLWFQTLSHKALRLMTPLLHVAAVAANVAIASAVEYRVLLLIQALFYACAATGYLRRHSRRRALWLTLPYTVCLLLAATVIAFARFIAGRQQPTWEPASPGTIISA